MRLRITRSAPWYMVPPPFVRRKIPPSTAGLARKQVTGNPAAAAFARSAAVPSRPVVALMPAGVNGCGLKIASGFVKLVLDQLAPVYRDASPESETGTPFKYAR